MTFPIENRSVQLWFLESFPTAPCSQNNIFSSGCGPWAEGDFDDLIRSGSGEVLTLSTETDVLVVGRDFGHTDEDEEVLAFLLEARRGRELTVYSQEMFLAHWITGSSPFDDREVAIGFLEGHPALEMIESRWFSWAKRCVEHNSIQSGSSLSESPTIGMLKAFGYTVDRKANLSKDERHAILMQVLTTHPLPPINGVRYTEQWGVPRSRERLKKIMDSLSFFRLQQSAKGNEIAASRYDEDLSWLNETAYVGRHNLDWINVAAS